MGRGRAKAKQTKVARELKYHSPNTDLAALQRELGGRAGSDHDNDAYDDDYVDESDADDDPDEDPDEDDESDDGNWAARSR
jgi:Protein of unknown function (DUF3073)